MTLEDIEITCPSCRNNLQVTADDIEVRCGTCGDLVLLAGHMCPVCSAYHEEDEIVCLRCGSSLSQTCPKCRRVNWSGHDVCLNCGESLDILSRFVSQGERTTADRLHEQMKEGSALKQEQESASIDHMSELLTIEEQRQAEIRRRVQKRKQDERRMIIIVGTAIAFFILVAAVLALVGSGT